MNLTIASFPIALGVQILCLRRGIAGTATSACRLYTGKVGW